VKEKIKNIPELNRNSKMTKSFHEIYNKICVNDSIGLRHRPICRRKAMVQISNINKRRKEMKVRK